LGEPSNTARPVRLAPAEADRHLLEFRRALLDRLEPEVYNEAASRTDE
jgi:hypothetical protein